MQVQIDIDRDVGVVRVTAFVRAHRHGLSVCCFVVVANNSIKTMYIKYLNPKTIAIVRVGFVWVERSKCFVVMGLEV